jgi:L-ascorbate metabolism protein UlaG (beta-lactamase superfamily)
MRITWLGWAGVEIEADGQHVVIDPLGDPAATFAWLPKPARSIPMPELAAPRPGALAGLLTHLHRDHADAVVIHP